MEISNEELLKDIENTETEVKAYRALADGYYHLSRLPENANVPGHKINFRYYGDCEIECSKFLDKLYQIKKDRGL
jgi:hypothetical protein